MFTGIIENVAKISKITPEGSNLHFDVESSLASELKIDQSVAHDGCCLTVVALHGPQDAPTGYQVTAIAETLQRTTLATWSIGRTVNMERCTVAGGRLDGHVVQGHVDAAGYVTKILDQNGSWVLHVEHPASSDHVTVPKGSIAINGTSLTVVEATPTSFSVALIPYTWEHTNFHLLKVGDPVNLEFDILGKYIARLLGQRGG
ncbi:MAG TPA: riboflavin synthase [Cryomorphaceae bacterium]|jgi:riboflavin synthase|nr:MAG: riboflavin synthase subunit alpha [Cryomorphaceae bacterium BACL7 MAG-120910-bin2]KRO68528.1 MAG: riboflavin synthase subunit alpha [Cryomorphaceae bacterium BACL7 MAG-120322-bin74]KRO82168.1 MAG: riboflavin synthase subunit alpha [Cryomorphaceae bacterium BACL7 MAG-121220-bin83]HAB31498.1 riboflavin synthase [Cryomorphaceae bacterium]HAG49626.1 riboflavin synthase [Cryomorphaceae bacterium]|tara:strand:- start:1080 stop:1688 length:609 start_codon:yes stop_codon:yes gene_type:complete